MLYTQTYRLTNAVMTESGSFRDDQAVSPRLESLLHLLEDKLYEHGGQARLVLPCREHSENILDRTVAPLLELLNFQETVTATFIRKFYVLFFEIK